MSHSHLAHSTPRGLNAKFLDNHLQTLQEGEELTIDANDNGEPDSAVMTTRSNLNSQQDPGEFIDEKDYSNGPVMTTPRGSEEFAVDPNDEDDSNIPVMITGLNLRKIAKPKRCLKDHPLSATSDSSTFSPHTSTWDISKKHT